MRWTSPAAHAGVDALAQVLRRVDASLHSSHRAVRLQLDRRLTTFKLEFLSTLTDPSAMAVSQVCKLVQWALQSRSGSWSWVTELHPHNFQVGWIMLESAGRSWRIAAIQGSTATHTQLPMEQHADAFAGPPTRQAATAGHLPAVLFHPF